MKSSCCVKSLQATNTGRPAEGHNAVDWSSTTELRQSFLAVLFVILLEDDTATLLLYWKKPDEACRLRSPDRLISGWSDRVHVCLCDDSSLLRSLHKPEVSRDSFINNSIESRHKRQGRHPFDDDARSPRVAPRPRGVEPLTRVGRRNERQDGLVSRLHRESSIDRR